MRTAFTIGLLLLAAAVHGESITRVEFHANRNFSDSELLEFLGWSDSITWSGEEDSARLVSLQDSLVMRDFLFARVDSSYRELDRRGRIVIQVVLNEGHLARIAGVEWLGDSATADVAIFRRMLTRTGELFRWENLEFDIQSLLSYFENSGYPFAEIEILSVEPDQETASVSLRMVVRAGPRTTLEFLAFPGLRQTRPSFL
ncbi:MAG: POTRA domain-containing protein, partial [bacterium]|nr:POTRA domain-containing protein [bacterium]